MLNRAVQNNTSVIRFDSLTEQFSEKFSGNLKASMHAMCLVSFF